MAESYFTLSRQNIGFVRQRNTDPEEPLYPLVSPIVLNKGFEKNWHENFKARHKECSVTSFYINCVAEAKHFENGMKPFSMLEDLDFLVKDDRVIYGETKQAGKSYYEITQVFDLYSDLLSRNHQTMALLCNSECSIYNRTVSQAEILEFDLSSLNSTNISPTRSPVTFVALAKGEIIRIASDDFDGLQIDAKGMEDAFEVMEPSGVIYRTSQGNFYHSFKLIKNLTIEQDITFFVKQKCGTATEKYLEVRIVSPCKRKMRDSTKVVARIEDYGKNFVFFPSVKVKIDGLEFVTAKQVSFSSHFSPTTKVIRAQSKDKKQYFTTLLFDKQSGSFPHKFKESNNQISIHNL